MELFQVELQGFKKFKDITKVKTRGKLLAILGPNEAGKTSLLSAINLLDVNQAYDVSARSKGVGSDFPLIKATYYLSQADRDAAGISVGNWYEITKAADGKRTWSIRPRPPARDYAHRPRLIKKIQRLSKAAQSSMTEEDSELYADTTNFAATHFNDETELSNGAREELSEIVTRWQSVAEANERAKVIELSESLATIAQIESDESQELAAGRILWDRLPSFLLFDEEHRNLKASYLWTELSAAVPTALANLAKVAELDMKQLIGIATSNPNDPEFDTLIERANAVLERKFKADWNQSDVTVALAHREQNLLIQVYNNDRARTDFAQRSDGLRQFVALRAFAAASSSDNIVLLIDEAEQHLHYDAQADLVQMLAGQTVASKVIYTTHSVGCLPEDLGNGVRLVTPIAENSDWSTIENKFWLDRRRDQAAFSPILMGMGASTMAFFPTRAAVLVEGPSDTILLPTMFREALGRSALGVQFIHGLSEDGNLRLPVLDSTGTTVCYLFDNDGGGRLLGEQVTEKGADPKRVFFLPKRAEDAELEDFLNPELLASAVAVHANTQGLEGFIQATELPRFGKWDFIENKCLEAGVAKPRKVTMAYEILGALDVDPQQALLDKRLRKSFRFIAEKILDKVTVKCTER